MKIMPDRRGKFFLRHFGIVAFLLFLGMITNGTAPISLPALVVLGVMTFPMNLLLLLGERITGIVPDEMLLEHPALAYGITGTVFGLLALNSYLWAVVFCRDRTIPDSTESEDVEVSELPQPDGNQLG